MKRVFNFMVFVDDKDPQNFFMKKAIIHEIYYTLYLRVEFSAQTNNIVHTCPLYVRYYISGSILVILNSVCYTCLLHEWHHLNFCTLQCRPVAEPMRTRN